MEKQILRVTLRIVIMAMFVLIALAVNYHFTGDILEWYDLLILSLVVGNMLEIERIKDRGANANM